MEVKPDDKLSVHTTTLESSSGKSVRRPSVAHSVVPSLSYQNGNAEPAREGWTASALEIEEPTTVSGKKVYTDYPEGGFGWVIVFCESVTRTRQHDSLHLHWLTPDSQARSSCVSSSWASSTHGASFKMRFTKRD